MTTFSQLVDEIAIQLQRPDRIAFIASQLNLTLREVFFTDRNTPAYYHAARVEEQITSAVDSQLVWTPANPQIFQAIETMRFDDVFEIDGRPIYATAVNPGRIVNDLIHFYYQTGDSIAISGFGGIGSKVSISYFQYVPALKYYPDDVNRPASYDIETGWSYPAGTTGNPVLEAAARLKTSNWLLLKWGETIAEGVRAKAFKHASDEARARVSFSLFQNLRATLYRAETVSSLRQ